MYVIRHRDTGLCLAKHRDTQPTELHKAHTWSRFKAASNRANRWKSDMTVEDMERLLAFYKHLSADSQEATCST